MTSPPATHDPLSRTARATRTRILEAARRELGRNVDSSLGDIAKAAGVARRTVYAHFAGRAALVGGLAADAGEAIRVAITVIDASAASRGPAPDAASALARVVLTLWPVGDRYRTLIGLARQDLGANGFSGLLTPVRDTVAGILARGQRQGVFRTGVPPGPLSRALEAHILVTEGGCRAKARPAGDRFRARADPGRGPIPGQGRPSYRCVFRRSGR
ncbi:TetR/AcrR family transcriptional regulator [Streptomyces phaeochromogenes]|uniref:TetR/AcrR family transcriptional regulator n=1 Tax=Streptomyces phaeochromogenes TaxID=1923 RepID=UPI0038707DFE|nr:TetR/AcrR family transcriptional regulator [Streptomyces phaeochromogenes]